MKQGPRVCGACSFFDTDWDQPHTGKCLLRIPPNVAPLNWPVVQNEDSCKGFKQGAERDWIPVTPRIINNKQ